MGDIFEVAAGSWKKR